MLTPEYAPVKFADVEPETLLVFTLKVAEAAPAGTLTLEGTEATLEFELDNAMTTPAEPAAAVSVTVPFADVPPATELGLREIVLSAVVAGGRFTVSGAVLLTPE